MSTRAPRVVVAALALAALAPYAHATGNLAWYYDDGWVYFESNAEVVYGLASAYGPGKSTSPALYDTIQEGADFLARFQNPDGGWPWRWNIFTHPEGPGASSVNLYGITALGLVGAYNATGDPTYLAAAEKAADHLVDSVAPNQLYYQDCWFLYEYSDAAGGDADALAQAKAGLEDRLAAAGSTDAGDVAQWAFTSRTTRPWAGYDLAPVLLAVGQAADHGVTLDFSGDGIGDTAAAAIRDELAAAIKAHVALSDNDWFWAFDDTEGTDLVLNQSAILFALTRTVGVDDVVRDMLAALAAAQNPDGSMPFSVPHGSEPGDTEGSYQDGGYAAMGIGENYNTPFDSQQGGDAFAPLSEWFEDEHRGIPEPATLSLIALGALALLRRRSTRRTRWG